ncbi:MAG: hypothetical protein LBQ59_02605 [Candidatus Peribacteria bacterium]|nr:hypothetical protein [Candidatus Peribacteria bacterium]
MISVLTFSSSLSIIHPLFSNLEIVSSKISVIVQVSFQFQALFHPKVKSKPELLFSDASVSLSSVSVAESLKEKLKLLSPLSCHSAETPVSGIASESTLESSEIKETLFSASFPVSPVSKIREFQFSSQEEAGTSVPSNTKSEGVSVSSDKINKSSSWLLV